MSAAGRAQRRPAAYYEGAADLAERQGRWHEALCLLEEALHAAPRFSREWDRLYGRVKEANASAIEHWNATYPEGTPVRFWPGAREGEGQLSRTRSAAWMVSDHASVLVDDYRGGICLTHVEVLNAATAASTSAARGAEP